MTEPTVINIHHAKTHLSRIVEEVAAGAEVIIAKAGRPVAKLVPLGPVAAGGVDGDAQLGGGSCLRDRTDRGARSQYTDLVQGRPLMEHSTDPTPPALSGLGASRS